MSQQIKEQSFKNAFFTMMKETFEESHGYYLDPDQSFFETLAHITAAEASRPVSEKCASIAAQVKHVNFHIEVLERFLMTGKQEDIDWGEVWRTTREVTPDEWDTLKKQLKETYQRILQLLRNAPAWDDEAALTGALLLLAHSAYHLGEIRQASCTVQITA